MKEASPSIIFKFDDYNGPSRRVHRLNAIVHLLRLKITWGIIGKSLELWSAHDVQWIKNAKNSGLYFFWNHGWTHEMDEFKLLSKDEAKRHIELTQKAVQDRCGLTLTTFGAPCNAISETTLQALEEVRDIHYWYYGDNAFTRTSFRRELELEYPLFHPRVVPFVKNLRNALAANGSAAHTYVIQGHPNTWHTVDFLNFCLIGLYLKLKGYHTVFPTEAVLK